MHGTIYLEIVLFSWGSWFLQLFGLFSKGILSFGEGPPSRTCFLFKPRKGRGDRGAEQTLKAESQKEDKRMFEQTDAFDQSSLHEGGGGGSVQDGDGFSQTHIPKIQSLSVEDQPFTQNSISQHDFAALEMSLHQQFNMDIEHCYNSSTNQEMDTFGGEYQYLQQQNPDDLIQNGHLNSQSFTNGSVPDLLNTFPLPRCSPSSLLPNSSITFSNSGLKYPGFLASLGLSGELNPSPVDGSSASASVVYDPLFPINLPPQPPLLRELFHSLPDGGFTLGGSRNGSSFFGGVDERDGLYQCDGRNFDSGVFEFAAGEIDCAGKNRDGSTTKHFATERHRRVLLNDKFEDLRRLLPNNTKNVRATILGDAIDYINELKRSVAELKGLVEKRRCAKERLKRPKTEDDAMTGNELKSTGDMNQENGSLRSSWLHRKSKNTEIDVRIVDDEVTVKLIQQKRINCLLFVSKVLDELQLDLHHVAGGLIGDYYSFLFNSKICEGSIVYASALANKLIEVVDKQYAAIPSSSSY